MNESKSDNKKRCVNIDWLEIYALENVDRYPCNADYFRAHGYFVKEREYGTRQYNEMFVIEDKEGNPWIEIRRNPASGSSSFCGLVPESTHIRLTNRTCYTGNAVGQMRDFLILHEYIFKRIFRIDICYDFEYFDSGDAPAAFCRRYLAGKYSKINQCRVSSYGADNWSAFDWETISWGSPHSMVTTKVYNKSRELSSPKHDKPYIRWTWFLCDLIDDPVNMSKTGKDGQKYKPEIWRVEFSLRSAADNWIVIEDQSGKRVKKKAVPHRLSMFDSYDKLWQRFEDLAFHYFRFKHFESGKRKDLCRDKVLFKFNDSRTFYQVSQLPPASKPSRDDDILRRRLIRYKEIHADKSIRDACDVILQTLSRVEVRRLVEHPDFIAIETLQRAIAYKLKYPDEDIIAIMSRIRQLLTNKEIF